MENEKDLPKPELDLPLPEKDLPINGQKLPAKVRGSTPNSRSKFLTFGIVILALGFILLTGGIFLLNKTLESKQKPCTQEAKICPDGSSVGRSGPNCEFAKCPKSTSSPTDTSTWKTYENEKYSLSYPSDWDISGGLTTGIGIYQKNKEPMQGLSIQFDLNSRWKNDTGKEIYNRSITWLNQPARLILGFGEEDHLILKTKINTQDYQLTMWGLNQKELEDNTDLFLKIANTIKLK